MDIESNFDRSAGVSQSSFSRNVTVIDGKATVASSSSRVDSIRPHGKPFSAAVALNTDDILEFYLSFSLLPLSRLFSSPISQWKLEIEIVAKTYPRNFLLRINLVVLRGRGKVQVPFAISTAYPHPVYLVFARSSVQTENRKQVYLYTDCLSLYSQLKIQIETTISKFLLILTIS